MKMLELLTKGQKARGRTIRRHAAKRDGLLPDAVYELGSKDNVSGISPCAGHVASWASGTDVPFSR